MKICWAGWNGPEMDEFSSGLLPWDPEIFFYELGNGRLRDESAYFGVSRHRKRFRTPGEFFSDLAAYDVVVHNTYEFSTGHRPTIFSLISGDRGITQFPEWGSLKAFKVLHDGESFTRLEFYRELARKFDGVITYNLEMKRHCEEAGIPCFHSYVGCPGRFDDPGMPRTLSVFYAGSCLDREYRKEILDCLVSLSDRFSLFAWEGAFEGLPVEQYVSCLNRAKVAMGTHSCADGRKYPFHLKNREGKALLCGALPIIEPFPQADEYLKPGVEKVVFHSWEDLREKVAFYSTHEAERRAIVVAGQEKIRRHYTYDHVFANAFRYFGLGNG